MFGSEFARSTSLQWALGALAFAYFIVFDRWVREYITSRHAAETLDYVCPKYFQSCADLYVLQALPWGYSQTIWYMLLFALLIGVVYALSRQRWHLAALLLVVPFLWHALNVFLLTEMRSGNYEYYLFVFGVVLLFLPHKEFFLKLVIVLFYTLSTVAKIHPAWTAGTYFSSLQTGLPLVPDALIPVATNLVILMEMVGAWFLFSSRPLVQRSVLAFFVCFHLYSGILVEYRYPATVLPMLLIMFGPWFRPQPVPLDRRSLVGWGLVLALTGLQFVPVAIPGDEKLTLEGNRYGLYMFEANHQCFSRSLVHYENGEVTSRDWESRLARNRCDPYRDWFRHQLLCASDPGVTHITWDFFHSINGGPFYHIVSTSDACALEYDPYGRNEWIKSDLDTPPAVGVPVQNFYY